MRYKDYATTTKSLGIRICGFKVCLILFYDILWILKL